MSVVLKVICQEVVERKVGSGWYTKDKSGKLGELRFSAVTGGSPENDLFFNSTPTANVDFKATNVGILDGFEIGKEYYVVIASVEEAAKSGVSYSPNPDAIMHHPV